MCNNVAPAGYKIVYIYTNNVISFFKLSSAVKIPRDESLL